MVRIFLTGATGYIGGQALHSLASSLPASTTQISCLVRDSQKAKSVRDSFPNHVQIALGDLEDARLIEEESRQADIVLHLASTNHLKSAQAIAKGLNDKETGSASYWIQISGASLFAIPEIKAGRYGEPPDEVYDDVKDSQKILAFIRDNPSRQVDNLVVAQDPSLIRTALVVGPLFYGQAAGPGNQRSIQVPEIARVTLKYGQGFRFLNGLNQWSNVNISDLGDLFVLLVQVAIEGRAGIWNSEGIYLPGSGVMTFGEICQRVASVAHEQGLVQSPKVEMTIDIDQANKVTSHGAVLWGTNAVFRSGRAQQALGWKPSAPTLTELIPETVAAEARRLQRKQ